MTTKEIVGNSGIVLVEVSATWCGPCKAMKPVIKEFKKQGFCKVVELDCDNEDSQDFMSEFRIQSVPTFIFFKDGEPKQRHSGAMPLEALIAMYDKI